MMNHQSGNFIAGCLFTRMELDICKRIKQGETEIGDCQLIPKIWFGLTSSQSVTNDINGCDKHWYKKKLEQALNDLLPQFETTIVKIVPDAQYIRFDYNVVKRTPVKKMTIKEIEEKLGYKIEIIGDK